MHRFLPSAILCLAIYGSAAAAEGPDPAKSTVLDVFPSGPWKDMNSVFQSPNFDATLDKDRVLRIQPKQDGNHVGPPVLVRFNAYYTDDGQSRGRDLVSLDRRPAPAMQPKKVELAGHYEQKIKFTFTIQFSEKGVTVDGDMKDPPKIKYPTVFAYAAYFSASHQIPVTTAPEEVKKLTEGHTVRFTDAKRQSQTMQFWEVVPTRPGTIASAEVSGPWGSRRVITELPATPKNGHRIGNFGNYAVTAFYKGGWYFSRGGTDKVPGGPLTVRVE
ncbi:MAG: hypothetical protein ABIP20_00950 [Chthoniobacteraceae bacterium]